MIRNTIPICLLFAIGCGAPVAAPTAYTEYNAKDGAFACDAPEGWEITGGKSASAVRANFIQGTAAVNIVGDIAGSILGGSGIFSDADGDPNESPVAIAHEEGKKRAAEEFNEYTEKEPEAIESGFGDGRKAEFTGVGSLGGETKGYRTTFMGNDYRFTITCKCSSADFETLKPAFDHIITSFRPGRK